MSLASYINRLDKVLADIVVTHRQPTGSTTSSTMSTPTFPTTVAVKRRANAITTVVSTN